MSLFIFAIMLFFSLSKFQVPQHFWKYYKYCLFLCKLKLFNFDSMANLAPSPHGVYQSFPVSNLLTENTSLPFLFMFLLDFPTIYCLRLQLLHATTETDYRERMTWLHGKEVFFYYSWTEVAIPLSCHMLVSVLHDTLTHGTT